MFKRFLFILLCCSALFCRADFRLTTSSGQEVVITDSQWEFLEEALIEIYNQLGNNQIESYDIKNILQYVVFTNFYSPAVFNLSRYSNTYSNLLSRFLVSYTNDLQVKFASLPTFSQTAQMRSYLQEIWEMTFKNYNTFASWNGTGNLTHSQYLQTNSIERAMRQDAKTIFDDWYIKNISIDPEYTTHTFDLTYDIDYLKWMIQSERNNIEYMYVLGYATSNPLILSNALIRCNAIQKLYEDKLKSYNENYQASLRLTSDMKSSYVDRYTGNIIYFNPQDEISGVIQSIQGFNASSMPINQALEFATNMLQKLNNPYDSDFANMAQEQKDQLSEIIQSQVTTACNWNEQKQLDDFINGLQQMLNTMSNCCANMSALPAIADMVSNLVENVGQDHPEGGGQGGGDTNNVANGEYPLGFPPSETNTVAYFDNWQNTPFSFYPVQTQKAFVDSSASSQQYESRQQNDSLNDIQTNVFKRVIPVISRFGSYARSLSRQSPPQSIQIIDTDPISQFARYTAGVDVDFTSSSPVSRLRASNTPGFMDLAWSYYKILAPLHAFFNVFWLLVGAFLLVVSWIWLFKRIMGFRVFLLNVWKIISHLFK